MPAMTRAAISSNRAEAIVPFWTYAVRLAPKKESPELKVRCVV
jgi:hypothetical protein